LAARTSTGNFEKRRKVIVRDAAMEADVCLDCRSAQMAVENRSCSFQTHSFIAAVQQFAQALYGARRKLRQPGS
jgi:hypothetical protein